MTIPKLVLDPQNDEEMLAQFHERVRAASGGLLDDTSLGSAQSAIGEGVIFSVQELLYYANLLPEATALEIFRLYGVERSPGTRAQGEVTVLLNSALTTAFTLPEGFILPYAPEGTVGTGYRLTQPLYIAPGVQEGTVTVEATEPGTTYNLEPFGLYLANPFNYVEAIYNVSRISGGSDIEPLEATILRGQRAVRSRDVLVSVADYEDAAIAAIGTGVAKVIPFLGSDKITETVGQVHVFLTDLAGVPPSVATCQAIQADLQARSFAASQTWVSPCVSVETNIELSLLMPAHDDLVANNVYMAIKEYLSPAVLGIGNPIRCSKLSFYAQSVSGIEDVISVRINGQSLDTPMPQPWSIPEVTAVTIVGTDSTGLPKIWYFGEGTGDTE